MIRMLLSSAILEKSHGPSRPNASFPLEKVYLVWDMWKMLDFWLNKSLYCMTKDIIKVIAMLAITAVCGGCHNVRETVEEEAAETCWMCEPNALIQSLKKL